MFYAAKTGNVASLKEEIKLNPKAINDIEVCFTVSEEWL